MKYEQENGELRFVVEFFTVRDGRNIPDLKMVNN